MRSYAFWFKKFQNITKEIRTIDPSIDIVLIGDTHARIQFSDDTRPSTPVLDMSQYNDLTLRVELVHTPLVDRPLLQDQPKFEAFMKAAFRNYEYVYYVGVVTGRLRMDCPSRVTDRGSNRGMLNILPPLVTILKKSKKQFVDYMAETRDILASRNL